MNGPNPSYPMGQTVRMGIRIAIEPSVLEWAIDRSRVPRDQIETRFPRLPLWVRKESDPTLKQAEAFALATRTPIGMLLLPSPPVELIPLPDFRTIRDTPLARPSADLLDTIYMCEQRQEWYRDHVRLNGGSRVGFVGAMSTSDEVAHAASTMRAFLDFGVEQRGANWSDALRLLIEASERLGVLMMVSGVVGSNSHRILDPQEFRGFVLADDVAPVIFINGADTKAAQIFTVAHELAHLWLGSSGVSDSDLATTSIDQTEKWCNTVAAEFLVPGAMVKAEYQRDSAMRAELPRLARRFKVSTLVVLRRLRDLGFVDVVTFRREYRLELARVLAALAERGSGGNFYNTQPVRVSKRFARALVESTLEGHTLYRDAFRMLAFKSQSAFDEMSHRLGVA